MCSDILLVGEHNPYGSSARFALYPAPRGSAGQRLCEVVMGLQRAEYLRRFDRANLCRGRAWSSAEAIERAAEICNSGKWGKLVLCGQKVAAAFGLKFQPFEPFWSVSFLMTAGRPLSGVILPHPSGRCRLWNELGAVDRAREALTDAGILDEVECADCSRKYAHAHCAECGDTRHLAADCDMEG